MTDLLHTYWYERIMLNFLVDDEALRQRLPQGWRPAARAGGSNVTVGFCEVWHDEPADVSSYLYIPVNGATEHEDGRTANMRYLTISDHPDAIGGCTVTRSTHAEHARTAKSDGGDVLVREAFRFDVDGGRLAVDLEYVRGPYTHLVGGMDVRCPDDASYARRYENEELQLRLRDTQGVDRVRSLSYEISSPALRDLFDGTERLMSVNSIPTSKRRVSSRSEAGADGAA